MIIATSPITAAVFVGGGGGGGFPRDSLLQAVDLVQKCVQTDGVVFFG